MWAFKLLELNCIGGFWVSIGELDLYSGSWHGSLLMIGKIAKGRWEFDLLYLRKVFLYLRDKLLLWIIGGN